MRILRQPSRSASALEDLGFDEDDSQTFQKIDQAAATASSWSPARPARARRPRSTPRCNELNRPDRKIITAEDPVEYNFAGINQVQVQRQDRPDVRQRSCARCCVRTPTSSWSAKSATRRRPRSPSRRPSPATWCSARCTPTTPRRAITRLIDMGVKPFLVALVDPGASWPSAWSACSARKCKEPDAEPDEMRRPLAGITEEHAEGQDALQAAGCDYCNGPAIRGRLGHLRDDADERRDARRRVRAATPTQPDPQGLRSRAA